MMLKLKLQYFGHLDKQEPPQLTKRAGKGSWELSWALVETPAYFP